MAFSKSMRLVLILFVGVALLPACNRKMETAAVKGDNSVTSTPPASQNLQTLPSTPRPEQVPQPVALGVPARFRDVFFDFDQSTITSGARESIQEDAELLKNHSATKIKVEGHCDERGTVEYNLALGNRRAEAVRRYLVDLGIEPSRISVISYGKEKPFCSGHNEACYKENRRGHFVSLTVGS